MNMGVYIRNHRVELLLFLGAFLVRALYAVVVQLTAGEHGFISFSDAEFFYYHSALNIMNHHVFSVAVDAPYYPDAFHTPLYPIFIAGLLFFKIPLFGIVLMQDLLAAGTVVLIYRIGKMLTGSDGIAFAAGILAAIEPMSIYWSGLLMTDVFFAFWMVLSFYLLLQKRAVAAAFTLGLATLARPIALYFFPVFVAMVVYQLYQDKFSRKVLFQGALLFMIAFALIVSPWYVRNKVVFDAWSLTSGGWYDLYNYSVLPFAQENGKEVQEVNIPSTGDTDFRRFSFEYTEQFKSASLAVIKANPVRFEIFQAKKSLFALVSNRYDYLLNVVLKSELPSLYARMQGPMLSFLLSMGMVFWLCVYTLILASLREKKLLHWSLFFAALVAINALISGGINPGGTDMSRYSLPFYPFFFTFAAIGFAKLNALFTKPE